MGGGLSANLELDDDYLRVMKVGESGDGAEIYEVY